MPRGIISRVKLQQDPAYLTDSEAFWASSSGMRTNLRGSSALVHRLIKSSAVSRVCLREATNTSTGLSGLGRRTGTSYEHGNTTVKHKQHNTNDFGRVWDAGRP